MINELIGYIEKWRNKSAGGSARDNQLESDVFWNNLYNKVLNNEDWKEFFGISSLQLIYRVHVGMSEPDKKEYEESGEMELYPRDMLAFEEYSKKKIDYNNHWASFTKNVDVVGSSYFGSKQMRGTVVVMKPEKYIDISRIANQMGFAEDEVVTPMNRSNVVEELSFEQFMEKYGKGTSDFEKFGH